MPTWAWILIAIGVVAAALAAFGAVTRRRTARLRERFGP